MTQFGIYPADPVPPPGEQGMPLAPIRGQMFVIVEADDSGQAIQMAIESGAMRPGDLHVIDLDGSELFDTAMETTVNKKDKPPKDKP